MKSFYTFCFLFLSISIFTQGTLRLTDTKPGNLDGITDDVRILTTYDNSIVYQDEIDDSRRIYVSDGTIDGSYEIMDLGSGGWIISMYSIGENLYANGRVDSLEEQQLFKISKEDFSAEIVLKDWETISNMQAFDGILYFNGEEKNFEQYFYKYTPETGLAEQIFEVYWFGGIEGFSKFKDDIYVMHWNESDDMIHLVKTNGEVGNKELVKKFPDDVNYNMLMTPAEDYMFFWFRSEENYFSLYKTDGTESGTKVLNTDFEFISFYDHIEKRAFTTVGNKYLYRARLNNTGNRPEFYATDADTETTVKLNIANDEDIEAEPEYFVHYDGNTYVRVIYKQFFNSDYAIYKTNGTVNGTKVIHGLSQMPEGYYGEGLWMTVHDDQIFHSAYTDDHGRELWSTKGTTNSNERMTDIAPGEVSSIPTNLTSSGENLFFFAESPEYGKELYVFNKDIMSSVIQVQEIHFEVYPNPGHTEIKLQHFDEFKNMEYSIISVNGEVVLQGSLSENKVSIENISNGAYILNIKTPTGLVSKRFVKM